MCIPPEETCFAEVYTHWYTYRQQTPSPRRTPRAILQGAAMAFASSGFAHTSMEDVAAACGVTKLIVYRHFDSKEVLYREILQDVFERWATNCGSNWPSHHERGLGARTLAHRRPGESGRLHAALASSGPRAQFAAYAAELRSVSVSVVRD